MDPVFWDMIVRMALGVVLLSSIVAVADYIERKHWKGLINRENTRDSMGSD